MRQIKFRAWDKEKNEWLFNDFTLIDITTAYANLSLYEVEFMQFTGLLDKNGKEIYHKDEVRDLRVDENNVYIIEWNEYGFYAGGLEDEMFQDVLKYLEVVGNVYENPELLDSVNSI